MKLQCCSWQWSTKRAQFSMTTSNSCHTTNASKVEQIELWNFASFTIYTWPLTNQEHLDNFFVGKHFHNQQDAENAFQGFVKSWSMDFCATGINKLLISKNVMIVMVPPILINTDVFVPSYNDLKFMIQNCNYFFTNLIARFCSFYGWIIFHHVCVLHVCIPHCLSPFFLYWVVWVLSVVLISTLIRYILWKYLLPFTRLPFHFVDYFLHCAKAFDVMLSHFLICFSCLCFWCQIPPKYC